MFFKMSRYCSGIFVLFAETRTYVAPKLDSNLKNSTFSPLWFARWCNGSTSDSESLCHGSNPCRAAISNSELRNSNGELLTLPHNFLRFLVRNRFVKIFVTHDHGPCAATRQAFDKLDRELAILARLNTVRLRIESELVAKVFVQLA